ncbi:C-_U-editing enzyme APOBEC-2-like [Conger conger]|uniref:C->U-editing enzyme APOBEC-2-like n=1 Tax=Conger conger TaxID=82655 RepID=UPI002A59C09F|nr:C->U-editing enzyme APOBEC-2-like [Conger conger]
MADKAEVKTAGQVPVKKKEKKAEKKTDKPTEKDMEKDGKPEQPGAAAGAAEQNGNAEKPGGAEAENGEFQLEPLDLPPLEVIVGERIDPFSFKFQFRNVEYSSGRSKNFLCFMVDFQDTRGMRGCLEAENMGPHAEEAFFQKVLPECDPKVQYLVTWYVCSSPCTACAAKLIEVLQARKNMRLVIYCSRIYMFEEPEIQESMKALAAAGCKLRMMKPADFEYLWDAYVVNEGETLALWEDCQDNYEYYETRLAEILP